MTAVEYKTSWGERVRLAVCSDVYAEGGALVLLALDVTDPEGEGYLGLWCALTVNLPDDPVASAWCAEGGHVVIDASNAPAVLVGALAGAGVIELSGRSVQSGFCSYPLALLNGAFSSSLRLTMPSPPWPLSSPSGMGEYANHASWRSDRS